MSTTTLSMLDQDELMQLALQASAGDDSAAAISYLKEAVGRADARGVAHYILGAEYAHIRMYDRAADEMEAALALDPALAIARLQLGLLWLSGGDAARARTVLTPLGELAADDALGLFGRGLCFLMDDQFADASACLQEGIARNMVNAPLNSDMQKILDEIARVQAAGPAATPAETESESEESARHIMLSAYAGNTRH